MDTATRVTCLEKPIHPKDAHRVRQRTYAAVNCALPECQAELRVCNCLNAVIGGLGTLKDDPTVTNQRSR